MFCLNLTKHFVIIKMKSSKLKFSVYLQNISWSNVFGKFVLIVALFRVQTKGATVSKSSFQK
jgi:hypothetical protein